MDKKMKPMSQAEIDYENEPVSPEAIQEMLDKKMRVKNEAAYNKAREYSLGSPDKVKPVKKAKGGMVKSSASRRADGCAVKGKTKGRMV
jgi:hypothetical protein